MCIYVRMYASFMHIELFNLDNIKCSELSSSFFFQNLKGATSMKMQILCFDSIMMHYIILRRRKKT